MPEVEEVFRMATQKVRRDPGAMERQIAKQGKAARNRRLGAFATVAAIIAVAVAVFALTKSGSNGVPLVTPSIAPSFPLGDVSGSMVDLSTGEVTPLPESIAAPGTQYAVSPDHTRIAYYACCAQPGPVMVANIDGTGIHPVTPEGQGAYGAQWSSDGSELVYQQRDALTQKLGNLFVVEVATGQRTQLTHFDQSQNWDWWFTFPSFMPDRDFVLYQLPRGNPADSGWDLWMVPVTGGKPSLVARNVAWGGLAPGGVRNLAYLSSVSPLTFDGGGLWISAFDLRGVHPRHLVRNGSLSWPRWSPDGHHISYSDGGSIYVLDVRTGSATKVAEGGNAEWYDDHTLIVGNHEN